MNQTFLGFLRKELLQALRDPRMRIMLFFTPVIQLFIFGYAISSEIRNIRLAVASRPDDAFTARLAERFYASGFFTPGRAGAGDPFDWVRAGHAEVVLVAPPEGADEAVRGAGADYQLLIDASNSERARGISQYAKLLLRQHLAAEGLHPGAEAFGFSVRTLYNPEGKTATYMIPGTVCLMLCLLTVLFPSMSMSRERELGTLETLLAAPVSPWEVLLGKTVPFVILGLVDLPIVLGVAWLMGVPIRGPLWEIVLASAVFICTAVSMGFLISSYMRSQQQAMLGSFLFLFPSIQLSGVIYPIENMPGPIAWLTYLNPLRYFVVVMRHLMLKGGDLGLLLPNLAAMAALGAASIYWAGRRFRQTLN